MRVLLKIVAVYGAPFDQDGHTFKLDGIKVRYFFTDNDAFRVKLGFGMKHNNFSTSWDEKAKWSRTIIIARQRLGSTLNRCFAWAGRSKIVQAGGGCRTVVNQLVQGGRPPVPEQAANKATRSRVAKVLKCFIRIPF